MTSTLIKYNVILIVLCIGITLIHNSSEATVKKDVILYYNHLSPQCRSVLLTLDALDLTITKISIDLLNGEKLPEEFREINSLQTVPVLQDDKFTFFESDAIIVYLVRQYGGKNNLLYASSCLTFQSLIIQQLIFNNINFYSAFEILHTAGISRGKQKTIEKDNKIHEALNSLEKTLEKSAWAVQHIMTLADFALLASISTFEATGFDLREYKKIQEWLKKCKDRMAHYYGSANQQGIDELKPLLQFVNRSQNKTTVNEDVILYYNHLSPQCRSVLLTLGALDLKITLKSIDFLDGIPLPKKFREINPLLTVPVLLDGDLVLSESHVIIVYLVQQYGGGDHSLYPKDPKIQARVNQILDFENNTLYPAFKNKYNPGTLSKILISKEVEIKIEKALKFLEEIFKKSTWAVGDTITLADFALLASISTFEAIGFYLEQYINILKWLSMCKNRMDYYDEANLQGIKKILSLLESQEMKNREKKK